ncbi:MAG: LAGLIDADG family homing endonuclease, partial [Sphaerochaetaceae bacterium]|nr:LAGLIDADG family homing endonuclease [Sphaerochaetaceae bacterium]
MARPRKHKLDENYFSTIDNPNKAYILGFLYADGSISKNYNITVCISKKDIEILEFIKKELKYSGDITTKIISQNEYSLLRIVSKKLSIDLINLGIVNNKTYESKQLPIIPNKYFNDLLRGFFDGDGSIYKNGDKGFGMSFSSNIYVLKQIKQYLKENDIKSSKIRLKNDSIYSGLLELKGSL